MRGLHTREPQTRSLQRIRWQEKKPLGKRAVDIKKPEAQRKLTAAERPPTELLKSVPSIDELETACLHENLKKTQGRGERCRYAVVSDGLVGFNKLPII